MKDVENSYELAVAYREKVFAAMNVLRTTADELELIVGKKYWSLPTYPDILYSVL